MSKTDTLAIHGVFSKESNDEILKKAWYRINPLSTTGVPFLGMKNEILMGLYNLTEL